MVFDVLNEVNQWRNANYPHKNIHVYIIIYENEDDLIKETNGMDCQASPIKFTQPASSIFSDEEDSDYQPLLMIYSHDPKNILFNVSALLEASDATLPVERQRRQTENNDTVVERPTPQQNCEKHYLQISVGTLNEILTD